MKNKDAYDRGNGIPHLPTVDMGCISQNTIVYFLSSILFLIQSLAHATYLFLLDQKKLYSDPSQKQFLHKLAYEHSLYIVVLNCPYYLMHLVLCKLCLLSYIHDVHVIEILCYEYLLFLS